MTIGSSLTCEHVLIMQKKNCLSWIREKFIANGANPLIEQSADWEHVVIF
jgi:hypothetical protein